MIKALHLTTDCHRSATIHYHKIFDIIDLTSDTLTRSNH